MFTNQLNVLVSLMIAIAFLVSESRNAETNGHPQFNQKPANGPRAAREQQEPKSQNYCGNKLSNTLHILCKGVYYSYDMDDSIDQEMNMDDYLFAYDSSLFLSRARARRMVNGPFADRHYRRKSRGIHEECCLNKCTLSDLSNYCG